MASSRTAKTEYPILDCLANRYSPYVFEERAVEREKLLACLEAARWAASSFNEQPWRFIIAERDQVQEFERAIGCLTEANQVWARNAGLLILTAVSLNFAKNGNPNRVAIHDLGLCLGNFSAQATALGLAVHQMAGINQSKIRSEYAIPEGFEPVTAVAVGYAGDPAQADNQELAARDQGERQRKDFSDWVFSESFGKPAEWI